MVCESERTGRFGGGVGGEPGDDGSERAVPGCDDELERERSEVRARAELIAPQFVPPRARRCTTMWFSTRFTFFFCHYYTNGS